MASLRTLDPSFYPYAALLYAVASAAGLAPRVTSSRRSSADQARLYRMAQQGKSAYPAAPPGTSLHEAGLAVDLIVTPEDEGLSALGQFWESLGLTWGGRFGDPIHFDARRRR